MEVEAAHEVGGIYVSTAAFFFWYSLLHSWRCQDQPSYFFVCGICCVVGQRSSLSGCHTHIIEKEEEKEEEEDASIIINHARFIAPDSFSLVQEQTHLFRRSAFIFIRENAVRVCVEKRLKVLKDAFEIFLVGVILKRVA